MSVHLNMYMNMYLSEQCELLYMYFIYVIGYIFPDQERKHLIWDETNEQTQYIKLDIEVHLVWHKHLVSFFFPGRLQ